MKQNTDEIRQAMDQIVFALRSIPMNVLETAAAKAFDKTLCDEQGNAEDLIDLAMEVRHAIYAR